MGGTAADAAVVGTAADGAAGSSVVITMEDAYRRRVFIEPLALYLVAPAGVLTRLELRLASAQLDVVYNATEWGETPWSRLRLTVTKTSSTRPGHGFVVERHGRPLSPIEIDNSTYAFPPSPGGTETVVTLRWAA